MTRLRVWIVTLMGVSFLAGVPAGMLVAERTAPPPVDPGPFAPYAALLGEEFELSPERRRALRVILLDYQRSLDEIRSRQLDRFEDEVVRAGRLCRERIRDVLLPEDQRERFDRMSAAFEL